MKLTATLYPNGHRVYTLNGKPISKECADVVADAMLKDARNQRAQ